MHYTGVAQQPCKLTVSNQATNSNQAQLNNAAIQQQGATKGLTMTEQPRKPVETDCDQATKWLSNSATPHTNSKQLNDWAPDHNQATAQANSAQL